MPALHRVISTLSAMLLALCALAPAQAHDTWFETRPAPLPGELHLALGTGNRFPVMEFPLGIEQLRLGACRSESAGPLPLAHDGEETRALRLRTAPAAGSGTALSCWAQTQAFEAELSAPLVAQYLKEIQAPPSVHQAWAEQRARSQRWTERYSKHARIELPDAAGRLAAAVPSGMALDLLLQDAYGGPNYFAMDPNALYEIHIDNDGDAREDISFQFRFENKLANGGAGVSLPIGGKRVGIPLIQAGTVNNVKDANLQLAESYTVNVVRGDRRSGRAQAVTNAANGSASFDKPADNIGVKTLPDYAGYAAKHIYTVNVPGCAMPAKLFVGQRQDGFAVNLGTFFDLVNAPVAVITDPALINAAPNTIADKNVTSLAIELHKSCLTNGDDVIGGWTSASLRQARLLNPSPPSGHQTTEKPGGAWVQVSRLGMPLVNEVVIGLKDKDKFNASRPTGDGQFIDYVTHPTLPALLEIALNIPGTAPTNFPRNDLVTTFLTGIKGVNQPKNVVGSEMLRLNTAIEPVPFAMQNRLGIVGNILAGGSDNAGYPNGRRPKDDIVDISLVAVMGGLYVANGNTNALGFGAACNPAAVPLGATAFKLHDAVDQAVVPLLPGFPYLNTPLPGSQ